jgi:hypothetical protein
MFIRPWAVALLLLLVAFLSSCVTSPAVAREPFPICTSPGFHGDPVIVGNTVYWWNNDRPSGFNTDDVSAYNLATGETFPASWPANLPDPTISGNIQVGWNHSGLANIYGLDLTTGEQFPITNSADPYMHYLYPTISGNLVVFQGGYNGGYDVYGYSLSTHQQFAVSMDGHQVQHSIYPMVSGNLVVWTDSTLPDTDAGYAIWGRYLDPEDMIPGDGTGGVVPEPGTVAMLGVGIAGLLPFWRRRHRTQGRL